MNQPATNQQRTLPTKTYHPQDHLIKIRTKEGLKDYYPAAWVLYELNLRYEDANFSSEILHLDAERNLVVVKCRLYLGPDYEMSHKKTEAMKSGLLSQLDKVETAAKVRCARDFGCGTQYALEYEDAEIVEAASSATPLFTHAREQAAKAGSDGSTPDRVRAVQALFASTYHVQSDTLVEMWAAFKVHVLSVSVADRELTDAQLARLHGAVIAQQKQQAQQGQQHKPARTAETVAAWFAKVYQVKPGELETKWNTFKLDILGASLPDEQLTGAHLARLDGVITQAWQRGQSGRGNKPAA